MRDYLTTLLERTLGRLEILPPRLPSRFEPVTPTPQHPGILSAVDESLPDELAIENEIGTPHPDLLPSQGEGNMTARALGNVSGREEVPSPGWTRESEDQERVEPAVKIEARGSSPEPLGQCPDFTPVKDVSPQKESPAGKTERIQLKETPRLLNTGIPSELKLVLQPVVAGEREALTTVPKKEAYTPHSDQIPSQGEGNIRTRSLDNFTGQEDALPAPGRTPPIPVLTASELRPTLLWYPPFDPPRGMQPGFSEQPTPTIKVTIGRLEVRAVQPKEPMKTHEPHKQTVMTLEEYLRQRAKGGAG